MSERNYWVFCDDNCRFPAMTKEQTLTAIMQAVNEGTIGNIDAGFITTIKTINGTPLKFFVGNQAEYEALTDEQKVNLFALITNDTTQEGIISAVENLQEDYTQLRGGLLDGSVVPARAENANTADYAYRSHAAEHADTSGLATVATKLSEFASGSDYVQMIGNTLEPNKTKVVSLGSKDKKFLEGYFELLYTYTAEFDSLLVKSEKIERLVPKRSSVVSGSLDDWDGNTKLTENGLYALTICGAQVFVGGENVRPRVTLTVLWEGNPTYGTTFRVDSNSNIGLYVDSDGYCWVKNFGTDGVPNNISQLNGWTVEKWRMICGI